MNKEKIRELIKIFNDSNIYDVETALLIYEYMDGDTTGITIEQIKEVYEFVRSQDKVIDEYVAEKIRSYSEKNNEIELDK